MTNLTTQIIFHHRALFAQSRHFSFQGVDLDSAKDVFEALTKAAVNETDRQIVDILRTKFLGSPFEDELKDFMMTAYDGDARKLYDGEKISSKDLGDEVPMLHYAALRGYTNLCACFIESFGFDVNAIGSERGVTPLYCAALENHGATVACLLAHGANVNRKGRMGDTPLHIAAARGYEELTQLLISRGSDIAAASETGTPLQCAAAVAQKGTVQVLLRNQANPNCASHCIVKPLLLAVMAHSVECTRLLINAQANPNAGACGTTPLCYAASKGLSDIVKCLLIAGADPGIRDFYDSTPLENAARDGTYECINILLTFTRPILSSPHLNFSDVVQHVESREMRAKRERRTIDVFDIAKLEGNKAFSKKEYCTAIHWYDLAISAKPDEATIYSNRSLCWIFMFEGQNALSDAKSCVRLRPDWAKAHCREGAAWKLLKDYQKALDAFQKALELQPINIEIQNEIESVKSKITCQKAYQRENIIK